MFVITISIIAKKIAAFVQSVASNNMKAAYTQISPAGQGKNFNRNQKNPYISTFY